MHTGRISDIRAVRFVLLVVAVCLGSVSMLQAFASSMVSTTPSIAHDLAPWDGQITGLLAESLISPGSSEADRIEGEQLAKLALSQDPTSVPALSTLGMSAWVRGDIENARKIFAYSERLSRRDLRTQLWMVEDAISRNDVKSALHHYDIALRVSETAPDVLYPVLGAAVSEPEIRNTLANVMATKPRWNEFFIPYVAGNGTDPASVALLFGQLQRAGIEIPGASQTTVIGRLIASGHVDVAWAYYASIRPGSVRDRSRDPHFAKSFPEPAPFDWVLINDRGITTSMQRNDRGGVVEFSAPLGIGGSVLRQMQLLPPGIYALHGRSVGIEQIDSTLPYWALTCASQREIGRVVVNNSDVAGGVFTGQFIVPTDCPTQYLTLVVRPSQSINGTVGKIEFALLSRRGLDAAR